MEDIQGKVFENFEPPATTDGSYLGLKKHVNETRKHVQAKFQEEITEINQRLKAGKTKVSLEFRNGTIQLRATLPLKPGDTYSKGKDKKQYTISLGIPANFDGLKTAEEEAQELGKLIARKTFIWSDKYLGVQAFKKKTITFNEFYLQFEERYFSERKKTIKSEGTLINYKRRYRAVFSGSEIITEFSVREKIKKVPYDASKRIVVTMGKIILNSLGIKASLSDLIPKTKPQQRLIPSDGEIEKGILFFEKHFNEKVKGQKKYENNWLKYKTVYALLAVYGLRPREVINNPDLDWLVSPENEHNTFKVHESNKTGYREVFPFVPEWIELFGIKNPQGLKMLKEYSFFKGTPIELSSKVNKIAGSFKSCGISFSPYDLRHASAIRAHLQGVPIKAAADNLGHSVEMHTKVYQRWFGLENRRKAFNQTFDRVSKLDELEAENTVLKKRIAELETELARFKLSQRI